MDLVKRVKAILLTPKSEWLVIERESGEPAYLFANYVAILAAIPAVCGFIGSSIIGVSLPIVGTVRVGIVSGIASAVVQYLLAFAMVFVVGLIIDALAPTFNGQKDQPNAMKLAVYSMTPAWLAGIFSLIPGLRGLGILGLYGLYLLWGFAAVDESAKRKVGWLRRRSCGLRDRHLPRDWRDRGRIHPRRLRPSEFPRIVRRSLAAVRQFGTDRG